MIGELGEAELADIARERRLGDGEIGGLEGLPELVLAGDALAAYEAENGCMALKLHPFPLR